MNANETVFRVCVLGSAGVGAENIASGCAGRLLAPADAESSRQQVEVTHIACQHCLSRSQRRMCVEADGFIFVFSAERRDTLYAAGDGLTAASPGLGFFRNAIVEARDEAEAEADTEASNSSITAPGAHRAPISIVLIGTTGAVPAKSGRDRCVREVEIGEAQRLAADWRCPYMEVNINVNGSDCTFHTDQSVDKGAAAALALLQRVAAGIKHDGETTTQAVGMGETTMASIACDAAEVSRLAAISDHSISQSHSHGDNTRLNNEPGARRIAALQEEQRIEQTKAAARQRWKKAGVKVKAMTRFAAGAMVGGGRGVTEDVVDESSFG
eukprot:g2146.t1